MAITDFFKDKCIFITGGSGFIGKVLIEKLLRSCDGIKKIYVLLRNKKNKTSEERLNAIINCPLFDTLKKIKPETVTKLVPICGDLAKPKLGLSDEDTQTLVENIDIIYHGAASIRFDDHLKDSILLNTRGTKEVVDIALQAKKLVTFIHISTAYCHSDNMDIEEKLYPPHTDWRSAIKLAEEVDQHTLSIFSTLYTSPLPNTYTFAKSLGEHVVNDLSKGKLLTAIVRPTIVSSSFDDPVVGWIDNFNGGMGFICACGKGLLKTYYADENAALDFIPVDTVVKILILATYEKALSKDRIEVSIYNAASEEHMRIRNTDLLRINKLLTWDAPYTTLLWYPSLDTAKNWYIFYASFVLYSIFPALILDGLLKVAGKKQMVLKLQRKIFAGNVVLAYFMKNTWKFKNTKSLALNRHVDEDEQQTFSFVHSLNLNVEDVYTYCANVKISSSKFLFNEEFNREKGFRNTMIIWILKYVLYIAIFGILWWIFIANSKI